jgi:hypothetical protein
MTETKYQGDETKVDVSTAPAQETVTETNAPEYITRDEFRKLSDDVKGIITEGFRGIQSQTDKFEKRVQQRMDFFTKAAEREGVTLTDSDKQALRHAAVAQELSSETQADASTAPTGQKGQSGQSQLPNNPESVDALAEGLMKTYGIEIEDDDPEADIIMKAVQGTPDQYLDAVMQAITTKRERTKSGAQVDRDTLRARSPGVTQGKPVANNLQGINDPTDLYNLHFGKK